jgi:hypothetical protein
VKDTKNANHVIAFLLLSTKSHYSWVHSTTTILQTVGAFRLKKKSTSRQPENHGPTQRSKTPVATEAQDACAAVSEYAQYTHHTRIHPVRQPGGRGHQFNIGSLRAHNLNFSILISTPKKCGTKTISWVHLSPHTSAHSPVRAFTPSRPPPHPHPPARACPPHPPHPPPAPAPAPQA